MVWRFLFCFVLFEAAGASGLGLDIPILIWIWSLAFGTPMIQILAFYLDFEGAKNIVSFKLSFGALEDAGGP